MQTKIKWGELKKYLPTELLKKTNIEDFISQEIIDDYNEVLKTENPHYDGDNKREWDYAHFTTKKGNYFRTNSIYNAWFVDPNEDKLRTCIKYKLNNNVYTVIGLDYKNHTAIALYEGENKLIYEHEGDKITFENVGDLFTISGVGLPDETTANK